MSPKPSYRIELLQGTLDLLVLRSLLFGPLHGYGITKAIQRNSDELLQVDHGSLYPALYRLEQNKWISGKMNCGGWNEEERDATSAVSTEGDDFMICLKRIATPKSVVPKIMPVFVPNLRQILAGKSLTTCSTVPISSTRVGNFV
jgi:hypothetical protein